MQHRLHQGLALMAGGDDGDVIVETILAAARGTGADVDEGSYLEPFLEAYVQVRLYDCTGAFRQHCNNRQSDRTLIPLVN